MTILALCLRILPGILLVGGIAALIGLVSVGPQELPKKHPLNRKLAIAVVILALGMAAIASEIEAVAYSGLALCLVGFALYTVIVRQARKEFPALSPEENLKIARSRYRFLDSGQKTQGGGDKKD